MGLFEHYVRSFIRSHFRPINPAVAKKWHRKATFVYFTCAWTAFGYLAFCYVKNIDKVKDSPYAFGRVVSPYHNMRKFGFGEEATLIKINTSGVEREVLSRDAVKEKCLK